MLAENKKKEPPQMALASTREFWVVLTPLRGGIGWTAAMYLSGRC